MGAELVPSRATLRRRSARVIRGGPKCTMLLEVAQRFNDFSPGAKCVMLFDISTLAALRPFGSVTCTLGLRGCDSWSKRVIENALPGERREEQTEPFLEADVDGTSLDEGTVGIKSVLRLAAERCVKSVAPTSVTLFSLPSPKAKAFENQARSDMVLHNISFIYKTTRQMPSET